MTLIFLMGGEFGASYFLYELDHFFGAGKGRQPCLPTIPSAAGQAVVSDIG